MKDENFIVIQGWMRNTLNLSGNELICFALVYGFTQDGETEFSGSLNYIANAIGVTKANAYKILCRLIERGFIEKREFTVSGVRFCKYVANRDAGIEIIPGVSNQQRGGIETIPGGGIETIPNNNSINISNDNKRRTSENLCLFIDSKFYPFEKFSKEFDKPEYAGVDLGHYWGAVADWSARHGKKQKDWIATARSFMRKDKEQGRLVQVREDRRADALAELQEIWNL